MRWAWAAVLLVGCLPQHSCQADLVDGEIDGGGGGVGGDGAGGDGVGGGDVSRCAFVDRAPTLDPAVDIRSDNQPFLYWDNDGFVLLASQDRGSEQCSVDQYGTPMAWRVTASDRTFKTGVPNPMCNAGCTECAIYNAVQDDDGVLVALLSNDDCEQGWDRLTVHALTAGQTDCRAEAMPVCALPFCTDFPGGGPDIIGPSLDAGRRGAFVPFRSKGCGGPCLDVGRAAACDTPERCAEDRGENWTPAGSDAIVVLDDLTFLLVRQTSAGTPFRLRLVSVLSDGTTQTLTDTIFARETMSGDYQEGFIGRVGETDRLWLVWREAADFAPGRLRVGQTASINRETGFLSDGPDRILDPDLSDVLSFSARATPDGLAIAAIMAGGESIEWFFFDNGGNLSASASHTFESEPDCLTTSRDARLQMAPSIGAAQKRFAMTWACDDEARYAEVRCAAAD